MMLLPLPFPSKPPIPILYTVTHAVVLKLDTQTEIADARRDGSAVGTTFGRMVNSVQTNAVCVLRGKRYTCPTGQGDDGSPEPIWKPVAILGGGRVAVSKLHPDERTPKVYAARVGKTLTVSRTALSSRPASAKHVGFGPYRKPRDFPVTWGTPRLREGEHEKPFSVRYARTPKGVVFGNGVLDTASGDMFDLNPQSIAILRRGGAESPLQNFVQGNPDLGAIVWISPDGWLICEAFRGGTRKLAWLEPVRR